MSIQRLPCLLKLSIFDDALWKLHVFHVPIEAHHKPSEAWRFIIAPIFSFYSNYKLTQKIIEFLCLYLFYVSVFLAWISETRTASQFTSCLVFGNVCLFFCSLINWLTEFWQSWKAKAFSFSHYLSSCNFLRYYPNQKSKRFNFLTKLPE